MDSDSMVGAAAGEADGDESGESDPEEHAERASMQTAEAIRVVRTSRA
jgi:hypothetical protein